MPEQKDKAAKAAPKQSEPVGVPPSPDEYPAFVEDSEQGRKRYDYSLFAASKLIGEPPESINTTFMAWRLYDSDRPL